ncbi:unnamed protein product [Miscanthus lutarioriparius]|uniref:Peroxidase n=1 Tax=Miscanthus lutarioriparius TaxID=422564 RepID=A0A811QA94_9POAL|nr:unnamed protein product [Miscanthus lutarioriparius]
MRPSTSAAKRQRKAVPLGDVTNLLRPETPTPIKPRRTARRPLPAPSDASAVSSTCSSSASVTPALKPSSSSSATPAPEPSSSAPVTPAPQPSSSTTVTPAPKPSFAAVLDEVGSVFESPTICTVYVRHRTTEAEAEAEGRINPTITNKGKEPVGAAASCPPLGKSTKNIGFSASSTFNNLKTKHTEPAVLEKNRCGMVYRKASTKNKQPAAPYQAASGAHTIGLARCTNFRAHIYNDTDIDAAFAKTRQSACPSTSGAGDNNLAPLDLPTPTVFENNYYKNLLSKKGLLHSDQELFNGGATDALAQSYVGSQSTFFADFVTGMIKMGDITPIDGLQRPDKEELQKS